jgi:hypothetical protein
MRVLTFCIICSFILATGCNTVINKQESTSSEDHSFRINENGDTILTKYNENGNLVSEVPVKNHQMNGIAINYYDNGKVQNEISYLNGQKHGRVTWNYENGKLYRETQYNMGVIDGYQKKYYENGKLMAEMKYKDGQLLPVTVEYTKEGNVKKLPEIRFEAIDKLAFDKRYFLRISLSQKQKETKFYKIAESMMGNPVKIPLAMKENYAEMEWIVGEGEYVMEKLKIAAEFTTNLGNQVILESTYNLAIENR